MTAHALPDMATTTDTYPELVRGESSHGSVDEKAAVKQPKHEVDHEQVHDGEHSLETHDMYVARRCLHFARRRWLLTRVACSSKPFPIDPDEPEETHQLTLR